MANYEGVQCFWADETGWARVELRRYSKAHDCPGPYGYHNASVAFGRRKVIWSGEGWRRSWDVRAKMPPKKDPRWPKKCAWCEYRFTADDHWQVAKNMLYRRLDTDEVLTLSDPKTGSGGKGTPGMLFELEWYPNSRPGPDGITLGAVCPNGAIWCVDGPASNGKEPAWTRTGEARANPPTVTATPSIVAGDYHGFLQDGRFTNG